MGGLVPVSEPTGVARIRLALEEQKKGNALAFLKLQHIISRGTQAQVTELLIGLTHFAVSLTHEARHAGANSLRDLMKTALDINFAICDSADGTSETINALLDAYRLFVLNLVSANVTFVEPALVCFAKRAFILSGDQRGPVMECIHTVIPAILSMHPQATDVLARVVNERHPHQVRKAHEISSYMRSILELALVCESETLCWAIIFTAVEKLLAIDTLVPEKLIVRAESTGEGTMIDVENTHTQSVVTFDLRQNDTLCLEAEKMDLVLSEVFEFLNKAVKKSSTRFSSLYLEPIYRAFERYVLPQHGTRFVPYVLFYAASLAGANVCQDVCERLRQSFFDCSLHEESRAAYLRFSCALIARCNVLPAKFCLRWMKSVAKWLNHYVDLFLENDLQNSSLDLDVNFHMLFYTAVTCLLKTIILRTDAFDSSLTRQRDSLAQMRLLRVFSSPMNPAFFIPTSVARKFSGLALEIGGLDLKNVFRETGMLLRSGESSSSSMNVSMDFEDLASLNLPRCSAMIDDYYRKSKGDSPVPELEHELDCVLDGQLNSALSASRIAGTVDGAPMILSSS